MRFLLRGDGALARTLAGAGVGVRPLAAHGKIAAMAQAAIALNFDQPADVHLHLLAEIALDTAFRFDGRADTSDFVLRQILDLLGGVHVGFFRERPRALLPDAVDCGEADPEPLVGRQIHTCNACHSDFLRPFSPGAGDAWDSTQITRTTPRR